MASRFEMLDKQLDRLEKLFSRKKRATDSHASDAQSTTRPATPMPFLTGFDATTLKFPQASYIRPTSSRMMARDEVLLSPNSRRARSLPESPSTPRLPASASTTGNENDGCPAIPARYSSFGSSAIQRSSLCPDSSNDDTSSDFLEFSFSTASRDSDCDTTPSRRSRPVSKPLIRTPTVSVSPKARPDRKRHSTVAADKASLLENQVGITAQQHDTSGLAPLQRESHCLGFTSREYLAPSMLSPVDDSVRNVSHRPKSLLPIGTNIKHASESLRKSISLSNLPTAKTADSDPILKEPSVKDFLALSDDDIADGHAASRTRPSATNPPNFGLPPNPSSASTPVRTKPAYPLLTLSPPLASRPATAAAFEAARIATKYQFDLVYVVNLWPGHLSRPSSSSPLSQFCGTPVTTSPTRTGTPSPPQSPVSNASSYDSSFESRTPVPRDNSRSATTGRLLAAYGLPSIMYPFRISAPVHQKVLRTQGWLEYRNETGAQDEFARGYSCAFYTGHSPARHESDPATTTTPDGKPRQQQQQQQQQPQKKKPANRGIVFAAFRLPGPDGTPVCSSAEELEALHRDAEALVDMLIDIHMTQRHRQVPATPTRRCVSGVGGAGGRTIKTAPPLVAI
ncbi:uncharacterized protein B0H64DRAFT_23001 [Chaetomium fimeti]|uniref:Uncharacterized protein n=1 Tax=Chaetomium fimeti TaxID=1854472 RepID=A0AAE0LX02_9PEZI|nr:hypothetical protein B0H64DRAFT_23001 [Chaetomium fimeti]